MHIRLTGIAAAAALLAFAATPGPAAAAPARHAAGLIQDQSVIDHVQYRWHRRHHRHWRAHRHWRVHRHWRAHRHWRGPRFGIRVRPIVYGGFPLYRPYRYRRHYVYSPYRYRGWRYRYGWPGYAYAPYPHYRRYGYGPVGFVGIGPIGFRFW